MKAQLQKLQQSIGYEFQQTELLHLALTHRSYHKNHNERLEFLGDAVLGMVVAEQLFQQFPKQPEGKLTRMRASLVNRGTLAKIAREIDLGALIKLGSGELKSGGNRRDSILSDALEALIGAVYLDGGFTAARDMLVAMYKSRLMKMDPTVQTKDSKTQLQEFLQSRRLALPEYEIVNVTGKDHAQTFTISCHVADFNYTATASGSSRRVAEQKAAQQVLENISK